MPAKKDKPVHYPTKGSEIQLTIGRAGEVTYIAIYTVIEGDGKNKMTLEFNDLRVGKESDIPF